MTTLAGSSIYPVELVHTIRNHHFSILINIYMIQLGLEMPLVPDINSVIEEML
eukprot:m.1671137 g.1671137  ORF g.1671137 m.1671137 type:complete len:53 (+) comp169482_c0_seq1:91-249(+)